MACYLITSVCRINGRATLGEDPNQNFKFWFNNV